MNLRLFTVSYFPIGPLIQQPLRAAAIFAFKHKRDSWRLSNLLPFDGALSLQTKMAAARKRLRERSRNYRTLWTVCQFRYLETDIHAADTWTHQVAKWEKLNQDLGMYIIERKLRLTTFFAWYQRNFRFTKLVRLQTLSDSRVITRFSITQLVD